jgi:hypothetical protein
MERKDLEFYVCLATTSVITDGAAFFVGMAGCALLDSDLGSGPDLSQNQAEAASR